MRGVRGSARFTALIGRRFPGWRLGGLGALVFVDSLGARLGGLDRSHARAHQQKGGHESYFVQKTHRWFTTASYWPAVDLSRPSRARLSAVAAMLSSLERGFQPRSRVAFS